MISVFNNGVFQDSSILNSLREVSKRANVEFSRDRAWGSFARVIGIPLHEGIPIYTQVNRAIKNINSELVRRLDAAVYAEETVLNLQLISEKIKEIELTSPTSDQIIQRQKMLMRIAFEEGSYLARDYAVKSQYSHAAQKGWVDLRGVYLQTSIKLFNRLTHDFTEDKLQKINLSNNRLKTVPEHLYERRHDIQALDLSNNQIRELPNWFKEMDRLEYLYLRDNLFEQFPEAIPNGCQLLLQGNPCFDDESSATQAPKRVKIYGEASDY